MKYYKYKLNAALLNIYAIILLYLLYILVMFTIEFEFVRFGGLELLIVIGWFILHELLHYVGFLCAKGTKTSDLYLGMAIEKGIFYCLCKKKINKKDILVALLFPLFFIGIVTLIIGYLFNNVFLILLSIMNISGAIGDILMSIQILKFPKYIKYFDLDGEDSYYILSKENLGNIKITGIKLIETNNYNENDMIFKDKRKIVISKTSWIFLIIIFLLFLITIFI